VVGWTLLQPEDQWPTQPTGSDEQCTVESRPGISLFTTNMKVDYHWDLVHRYSSLNRLLRITTLCPGFVLRLKGQYDRSRATCISVNDIKKTKIFWIKATQSVFFCSRAQGSQLTITPANLSSFQSSHSIYRSSRNCSCRRTAQQLNTHV